MRDRKWMMGLLVAVVCVGTGAALAGSNDDCSAANAITLGVTAFDTTSATTDGPEHPGSGCDAYSDTQVNQDVWFDYQSDCTGTLSVSTCSDADFDTRLAIYEGCDCPMADGDLLVCNDDGDGCAGYTSYLETDVVEGQCYKIRVGGYTTATGTGNLTLTCTEPFDACVGGEGDCFEAHATTGCDDQTCCEDVCAADDYCCTSEWDASCVALAETFCGTAEYNNCEDAAHLDLEWGVPQVVEGSGIGSTIDCPFLEDTAGEVWVSFTIDTESDVEIAYCGSDAPFQNIWVIVFDDCPCGEAYYLSGYEFVGCSDGNPTLRFPQLPAGTYYHPIMYDPESGATAEHFVVTVTASAPSVFADDCADAAPVYEGHNVISNIGATTDGPAHPGHEYCDAAGDDQVNQDIWFEYTATCTDTLSLSTCNQAGFDTRIAVYDGCDCPVGDADLIGCNDDGEIEGEACGGYTSYLEVSVEAGSCYLVRVGAWDVDEGVGTLTMTCGEPVMGACCLDGVCVGDMVEFACDGDWYEGETCDSFECPGSIALVESVPVMDSSFWRNANNHAMLTFDGAVTAPATGQVMIQQLLPGGAYGADLSADFTFAADGTALTIDENGSVLEHGFWYAVRNDGGWAGVEPFELHFVVAIGDATAEGLVLPNDLSLINTAVPSLAEPADSRFDINGDGRALPNDLSLANSYIPSFAVPKPAGH